MIRLITLVFVILTANLSAGTAYGAFQWEISAGGNGHYYELVLPSDPSGNVTWFQANEASASSVFLGSTGHLVTVTSAAEDAFLRLSFEGLIQTDFFGGPAGDFVWIGLTDIASEGSYQWITGESFSYSNWAPPEPNNLGDEDYGVLWRRDYRDGFGPRWSWNDTNPSASVGSDGRWGYIIEYGGPFDSNVVPEPATIITWGVLAGFFLTHRRIRQRKSSI